jgi:uncharacterized protein (UPF0332 family)
MIPEEYKESLKALEKAADAIENAKYNYQGEFFGVTANRTYYACYYCLIALLYTQKVYSKTHQGTKAKFSELFIKTGIFPVTVSDAISLLFDYRQEADYDLDAEITQGEADSLISKASEIYILCHDYFQKLLSNNRNGHK